ncbi:succinate:fumarate antiporter [Diaporthe sp. PMI_573]|nr:succinate:fumarate antiporter [Diaporthaceae sp. PMI_573]
MAVAVGLVHADPVVERRLVSPFNTVTTNLLAGGGAGIMEACSCHPLDTIKVRMQLLRNNPQGGFISTMGHIVRNEGLMGLYRGFDAVVLGIGPKMAIRFSSFEGFKHLGVSVTGQSTPSSSVVFLAGLAAGITESVCVVNPMEVVKIRLQAQDRLGRGSFPAVPQYRNAFDAARSVVRNEGISSLWRGVSLTATRQGTNQAANFTTYSFLKGAAQRHRARNGVKEGPLPTYVTGVIGLFSGAMGPLCNAPIDTIKTRLQSAGSHGDRRILVIVTNLIRQEGPSALYKGLMPRVMRVAPGQAVTFMAYEFFKRHLDRLRI